MTADDGKSGWRRKQILECTTVVSGHLADNDACIENGEIDELSNSGKMKRKKKRKSSPSGSDNASSVELPGSCLENVKKQKLDINGIVNSDDNEHIIEDGNQNDSNSEHVPQVAGFLTDCHKDHDEISTNKLSEDQSADKFANISSRDLPSKAPMSKVLPTKDKMIGAVSSGVHISKTADGSIKAVKQVNTEMEIPGNSSNSNDDCTQFCVPQAECSCRDLSIANDSSKHEKERITPEVNADEETMDTTAENDGKSLADNLDGSINQSLADTAGKKKKKRRRRNKHPQMLTPYELVAKTVFSGTCDEDVGYSSSLVPAVIGMSKSELDISYEHGCAAVRPNSVHGWQDTPRPPAVSFAISQHDSSKEFSTGPRSDLLRCRQDTPRPPPSHHRFNMSGHVYFSDSDVESNPEIEVLPTLTEMSSEKDSAKVGNVKTKEGRKDEVVMNPLNEPVSSTPGEVYSAFDHFKQRSDISAIGRDYSPSDRSGIVTRGNSRKEKPAKAANCSSPFANVQVFSRQKLKKASYVPLSKEEQMQSVCTNKSVILQVNVFTFKCFFN